MKIRKEFKYCFLFCSIFWILGIFLCNKYFIKENTNLTQEFPEEIGEWQTIDNIVPTDSGRYVSTEQEFAGENKNWELYSIDLEVDTLTINYEDYNFPVTLKNLYYATFLFDTTEFLEKIIIYRVKFK